MKLLAENNNGILESFVAISSWQAAVGVLSFFAVLISFWLFLKYVKIGFMYRVLIGLGLGLIFGLAVQGIAQFPENGLTSQKILTPSGQEIDNPDYQLWAVQLNIWISLFKNIFMNSILMLTAPVVFIAIFKVTSKPGNRGVGRITVKGISLLLLNVLVGFVVTFWLGILLKVGQGSGISEGMQSGNVPKENKPIPQLIWDYFPTSFAGAWVAGAVIPLMILGALFGSSVKILSRKKEASMNAIRSAMDTGWSILISVLMTFMKIMPLAVLSMIASSLVSKPIGALSSIGKSIGLGYLGLLISMLWLTLLVFLSGIKIGPWWKEASKVLVQGFATQSSNATLPVSIETLKDKMKVSDNVVGTIAPLSTSMGLMGCAGVQAGVVTSFLWTGTEAGSSVHTMGLAAYFIVALVVTLVASLGIAGVPGTAAVVTAGVLGGLGLSAWFAPVYAIIGALDGLFDMGRTGVNVLAGVAVAPIIAKSEGQIEEGSPILTEKALAKQIIISKKISDREDQKEAKALAYKQKLKEKIQKKLDNSKANKDDKK